MARRAVIGVIAMDVAIADAICDHLDRRVLDVRRADENWQAGNLLDSGEIDVMLVGYEANGGAMLDLLRKHGGRAATRFLVMARGGDVVDRVLALELGAADVVDMATPPREIAARIAGLLRRAGTAGPETLVLENATVDLRASLVMHRSGREELLSPGQLAMLRLFVSRPRTVISREQVLEAAPAEATDAYDRSIDSRIVRLRRKLDTSSIVTIRGAGYRFDPPAPRGETALPEG
jgi:two-component system OmpR family response regulator